MSFNKESFLKELLLNANEAVNKLDDLKKQNLHEELKDWVGMLEVYFEPSDDSITIVDNGIGMNKEQLEQLSNDKTSKIFSSFLIGEKVTIISKKLGETTAYKSIIDNLQTTLSPCINDEASGTVIYIKLKKEFSKEFTNKNNLLDYIKKFIKSINNDLFISYYDNFEEKIEKIN